MYLIINDLDFFSVFVFYFVLFVLHSYSLFLFFLYMYSPPSLFCNYVLEFINPMIVERYGCVYVFLRMFFHVSFLLIDPF